jgi:aryl-alcohol dehydrogenase-like predicted oxidoreductase
MVDKPLHKIGLGTAQFGLDYGITNSAGRVKLGEVKQVLQFASSLGVSLLDTAHSYGDAERRIGDFGSKRFDVVTKLSSPRSPLVSLDEHYKKSLLLSLSRLRVDRVYGVLAHDIHDLDSADLTDVAHSLMRLRESGLTERVGISVYHPHQLEPVLNEFVPDMVQLPFNLVDRRFEESGWLKTLKDMQIEVHSRSIFLQGLLLIKAHEIPDSFSRWRGIFLDLESWCREHNFSKLEAALGFALSNTLIDRVIVGVASLSQLQQIHLAAGITIEGFPAVSSLDLDLIDPSRWKHK